MSKLSVATVNTKLLARIYETSRLLLISNELDQKQEITRLTKLLEALCDLIGDNSDDIPPT